MNSVFRHSAFILWAAAITPFLAFTPAQADDTFDQLAEAARTTAAAPYAHAGLAPDSPLALPGGLADLKYDGHRDIRNPPAKFLWAKSNLPFRVQFKHLGWLFPNAVALSEVDPATAQVTPVPFDPARFTYGPVARETLDPSALPQDLGYAGLSLHHVATPEGAAGEFYNEILSIQGGSYFRAVGTGQHWGASVRAVAIDTALPDRAEEFPRWTQLWAQQPAPGDTSVTLYGLMEGPSLAGAYRLIVTPGETLSVDVHAQLFFRHGVSKFGLAPITSMFLFGEDRPASFGDYRPEVHDSDGLSLVHADGRHMWRPLHNPFGLSISHFDAENPRGFGLLQRDRDFDSYEDLETEMQLRPSIWVTPKGDWGKGHLELVEFGSKLEATDNIGAYWIPNDTGFNAPGGEYTYGYTVAFTQQPRPLARETQTSDQVELEPQESQQEAPQLLRFAATR
ncbi:MAG: glucan biosynthesis protein, partial [Algisphaera sp.]